MAAHPVSDELAARLVALFPLYNDIEIGNQVSLNRTTVGKHRAVWRAAELAKLDAPPVDKMASLGPPPSWASCAPQVRVAPLPPGVTAGGDTIPSPPYPDEVRAYPEVAPSDNKGAAVIGSDNSRLQRVLIFGDAHIPYHDRTAWRVMLAAAEDFAPDIIVCLGDLADCYSVSGYTGDPSRPLRWEDELIAVNDALDELDSIGAERKVFCAGNHEDRLPRYLAKRAPELYQSTSIPSVYRIEERGWEYVPYGQSVNIGQVMFTHDLDRYGIYAVRHALRDAGTNVCIGHVHRACIWYEGSMSGNNQVAASFGWLGGVEHATYRHRVRAERDWQLGFGLGYLEPDGVMHLVAVPIIDGRCVIEGRRVSA